MKRIILVIFIISSYILIAQTDLYSDGFSMNSLRNTFSFLNSNKISMNQSVSFMSGYSSNKQGFYQSMYTNTLNYRLNPKLNLRVDLNFVNNGSVTFTRGIEYETNNDNQTRLLPNFSLDYQPTENMHLKLEFRQYGYYDNLFQRNQFWRD